MSSSKQKQETAKLDELLAEAESPAPPIRQAMSAPRALGRPWWLIASLVLTLPVSVSAVWLGWLPTLLILFLGCWGIYRLRKRSGDESIMAFAMTMASACTTMALSCPLMLLLVIGRGLLF